MNQCSHAYSVRQLEVAKLLSRRDSRRVQREGRMRLKRFIRWGEARRSDHQTCPKFERCILFATAGRTILHNGLAKLTRLLTHNAPIRQVAGVIYTKESCPSCKQELQGDESHDQETKTTKLDKVYMTAHVRKVLRRGIAQTSSG